MEKIVLLILVVSVYLIFTVIITRICNSVVAIKKTLEFIAQNKESEVNKDDRTE